MDTIDRIREAARNEATCIELSRQNKELRARVARLEEALKEILGWRELRGTASFPVERVEDIARRALEEK